MKKTDLMKELKKAQKALKNHTRFLDLFSKEPKGTLTRLGKTVSRVILLLNLNKAKDIAHPENKALQPGWMTKQGCMVKIRPCGAEYKDKTYLGFYIGDVAMGSSVTIKDKKIQLSFAGHNPAIFVPELRKVIYGCESWWGEIKNESELKDITDNDINNVWYVQALKAMAKEAS